MEELPQIKYSDQLILTTEQLAEFYGATVQQIKQNFANNKDKFIEGIHFYLLEGAKLKAFKNRVENIDLVGKNARSLVLYTKRGAGRHSKMLGTDKAWDMFDELEENYFNPKPVNKPLTAVEQIKLLPKAVVELDDRVTNLEENQVIPKGDYDYIASRVNKRVSEISHGYGAITQKQRGCLFKDINGGIKQIAGVNSRSNLRKKDYQMVVDFIADWEPSTATKMIIRQTSLDLD